MPIKRGAAATALGEAREILTRSKEPTTNTTSNYRSQVSAMKPRTHITLIPIGESPPVGEAPPVGETKTPK